MARINFDNAFVDCILHSVVTNSDVFGMVVEVVGDSCLNSSSLQRFLGQ